MACANLTIILELKLFLETISSDASLKKLVTVRDKDLIRNRKLSFTRLVCFIINMPKRSLSIELQDFFDTLGITDLCCTKSALSQQRSKLKPVLFQVWNQWLLNTFYHIYEPKVKRWNGFRLLAADGSTSYLVDRKEVIDHFGTQDNQHTSIPMARIMQVHDLLNDLTVWGDMYPVEKGEQEIMCNAIPHLFTDSVTVFDRGFPSFALMYLLISQETPRHFVMRCRIDFNREVRQFVAGSKSSMTVALHATDRAIETLYRHGYRITSKTQITLRMVKVKLANGTVEVLLTNLYDEQLYTVEDLKCIYGLRWGIETMYNKQKNQQQMEQFSGHRTICIQQDYAASLFVANLQSILEKGSDDAMKSLGTQRRYRYKINRNIGFGLLKQNIVRLFFTKEPGQILTRLQKGFEQNTEPVRPGRQNPRVKKRRRQYGKIETYTNYRRAI